MLQITNSLFDGENNFGRPRPIYAILDKTALPSLFRWKH